MSCQKTVRTSQAGRLDAPWEALCSQVLKVCCYQCKNKLVARPHSAPAASFVCCAHGSGKSSRRAKAYPALSHASGITFEVRPKTQESKQRLILQTQRLDFKYSRKMHLFGPAPKPLCEVRPFEAVPNQGLQSYGGP